MQKVSVIIPSHNRPGLLRQAITSVQRQSYPNWEVIVVDDGSQPPIDQSSLREEFGRPVTVCRNDSPRKLPLVRHQGVEASSGEIVVHLDDDDSLAPATLSEGVALLEGDPALDIVFLGVKGFGKYAKHFARAQSKSLQTVLRELKGIRPEQEVIKFGPELFDVLLKSVPQHFQHIMARRAKWLSIDRLRKKTYYLDPAILDEDSFRRCITAPRSDSEFAIYASLSLKTALINRPLYLFRCDGQGFISRPSQKTRQIESQVRITRHLFLASRKMPEFMSRKKQIRASLARVYFSAAYHFFYEGNRAKALKFLSKSAWVQPRFLCIKFGARMLLPRSW